MENGLKEMSPINSNNMKKGLKEMSPINNMVKGLKEMSPINSNNMVKGLKEMSPINSNNMVKGLKEMSPINSNNMVKGLKEMSPINSNNMVKGLKEMSPINSNNMVKGLKEMSPITISKMNKEDLNKLSKEQLIRLLLKQEKKKPKVVIVNNTKPTRPNRPPPPIPEGVKPFRPTQTVKLRKKQKVVDDRPGWVRNPKTNRWIKIDGPTYRKLYPMQHVLNKINKTHQEINETSKSIDDKYKKVSDGLVSSPKITQIQKAHKNSTKSFSVDIIDNKDPLNQLTKTQKVIEHYLNKELGELKGFKYIETLKVTFEKQLEDEIISKTAYFNSKTKTLINENEINEVLQTSRQELIKAIGQWISEGSSVSRWPLH